MQRISKKVIKVFKKNYYFCTQKNNSQEILNKNFSHNLSQIPSIKEFLSNQNNHSPNINNIPYQSQSLEQQPIISPFNNPNFIHKKKFHIQTYGCQMNVNDSQIVRSLLSQNYQESNKQQADVVLLNTCAIRQAAQQKIYHRINEIKKSKVVAVLGCMAERIKQKMFQHGVHVVCGPDAYRDLPRLVNLAFQNNNSINVQLSAQQTYAQISPIRKNSNNVTAFVSIMRGCNNMCSFCIVPFVRGRQRSQPLDNVLKQIQKLQKQGVKQITFLGQNVNSYHDTSKLDYKSEHMNSSGFSQMFKLRDQPGYRFADLLQYSAKAFPNIRFRFTSPHPKDFPDKVLTTIRDYANVCNYIHLPAQSGNTEMLFKMRRNHSRQAYIKLVQNMRSLIPNLALSTDLMCGFCGQTEQQFQDTMSLIRQVRFDMAYLFAYSMRQKTHAHRNFQDDIPDNIKKDRLKRMIDLFVQIQAEVNSKQQGKTHLLLIEGKAKKDQKKFMGKTDTFKKGYIQQKQLPVFKNGQIKQYRKFKPGDYVAVNVTEAGPRSLQCQPHIIVEQLQDFFKRQSQINKIINKEYKNVSQQQKLV